MYQNCVLVKVFEMNRIVLGIKLGCLMIEVNVFKVFVFIILCGFSFYYYV